MSKGGPRSIKRECPLCGESGIVLADHLSECPAGDSVGAGLEVRGP